MSDQTDPDAAHLRDVSRELPALDLDPRAAERIAGAARRGPPMRRTVEVVVVALFAIAFFAWAVYKVVEAFR